MSTVNTNTSNAPLSIEERIAAMAEIARQVNVCPKCDLAQGRTHAVPGAGPINAEIMFIGEGPGYYEDQKGLPFVGASGKFLEELLALIGMNRDQVFISNVVKCRPPGNRDPLPDEIDICTKNYLYRQIELINPKIIATLGRFSMGLFFPNAKITAIHGQPKKENGRIYIPLFHPAFVLRNLTSLKPQAEADIRKLPGLLADFADVNEQKSGSGPLPPTPTPPDDAPSPPAQLTLF